MNHCETDRSSQNPNVRVKSDVITNTRVYSVDHDIYQTVPRVHTEAKTKDLIAPQAPLQPPTTNDICRVGEEEISSLSILSGT